MDQNRGRARESFHFFIKTFVLVVVDKTTIASITLNSHMIIDSTLVLCKVNIYIFSKVDRKHKLPFHPPEN